MVSAISNYSASQSSFLQGLQNKYAKTDTNSNGVLSLSEFQAGAPEGLSGVNQQDLFKTLDKDSDGSLTQEEFTSGFEGKPSPPPSGGLLSGDVAQHLRELFQSVDADGDGALSQEEFVAGAQDKAAAGDSKVLEEAFSALDTDENGTLSEEEFTSALAAGPAGASGPPPGGPPPGSSGISEEEDSTSSVYDSRDTNEDGIVSLDELLAAQSDEESNSLNQALEDLFNAFDQDEDGQLTKQEADAGFNALRKATLDYLISLQGEGQAAA